LIERQWGHRSPLESFATELTQELMGVESEVACRADFKAAITRCLEQTHTTYQQELDTLLTLQF